MDAVLEAVLRNGITTSDRQTETYTSDSVTYTVLGGAASIRNISLLAAMGAPASFVRVIANQACEFWFKKPGQNEKRYYEGLVANVGLNLTNENIEYIRLVPAAYPCTFSYYASAYLPAANKPVNKDTRRM